MLFSFCRPFVRLLRFLQTHLVGIRDHARHFVPITGKYGDPGGLKDGRTEGGPHAKKMMRDALPLAKSAELILQTGRSWDLSREGVTFSRRQSLGHGMLACWHLRCTFLLPIAQVPCNLHVRQAKISRWPRLSARGSGPGLWVTADAWEIVSKAVPELDSFSWTGSCAPFLWNRHVAEEGRLA